MQLFLVVWQLIINFDVYDGNQPSWGLRFVYLFSHLLAKPQIAQHAPSALDDLLGLDLMSTDAEGTISIMPTPIVAPTAQPADKVDSSAAKPSGFGMSCGCNLWMSFIASPEAATIVAVPSTAQLISLPHKLIV